MFFTRSTVIALLSAPLLALAQSMANAPKVPQGFSGVAGSPLTLSWTPSTSGTVTLVLRTGASSDLDQGSIIASNVQNSGSYTWQIPSDTVRNSDYTVEIVSDSDHTAINYWPFFVIDSTVTVATTTASVVTLGAPTSSIALSSASPTASAVSVSSGLSSVLSTASMSGSTSMTGSSSMTGSTSHSSGMTTSTSTGASSTGTSAAAGFQTTSATATHNSAPKATAMAGMLGLVALGALAL